MTRKKTWWLILETSNCFPCTYLLTLKQSKIYFDCSYFLLVFLAFNDDKNCMKGIYIISYLPPMICWVQPYVNMHEGALQWLQAMCASHDSQTVPPVCCTCLMNSLCVFSSRMHLKQGTNSLRMDTWNMVFWVEDIFPNYTIILHWQFWNCSFLSE